MRGRSWAEAFTGWVRGQGSLWVLENQPEPPAQRGELAHGPTAGHPSFKVSMWSQVPPLPHLALQLVVIFSLGLTFCFSNYQMESKLNHPKRGLWISHFWEGLEGQVNAFVSRLVGLGEVQEQRELRFFSTSDTTCVPVPGSTAGDQAATIVLFTKCWLGAPLAL